MKKILINKRLECPRSEGIELKCINGEIWHISYYKPPASFMSTKVINKIGGICKICEGKGYIEESVVVEVDEDRTEVKK